MEKSFLTDDQTMFKRPCKSDSKRERCGSDLDYERAGHSEFTAMNKRNSAFTLLELLIVVVIIAVLAALAMPFYQDYVARSKFSAAKDDLATFQKAFAAYDQLEDMPIKTSTVDPFVTLIGKYLQDFRVNQTQKLPLDPWGRSYQIDVAEGVIWSMGPNGLDESSTDPGTLLRKAFRFAGTTGDDILTTWKPQFYIVDAKAIEDLKTVEITFSRKVIPAVVDPATNVTATTFPAGGVAGAAQRVSDTVFRILFSEPLATGDLTFLNAAKVTAMDGKVLNNGDTKPDNTAANVFPLP